LPKFEKTLTNILFFRFRVACDNANNNRKKIIFPSVPQWCQFFSSLHPSKSLWAITFTKSTVFD